MGLASLTVFVERVIALRRTASRAFAMAVADQHERPSTPCWRIGPRPGISPASCSAYDLLARDHPPTSPSRLEGGVTERYMEEIGADLRPGSPCWRRLGRWRRSSLARHRGGHISAFQGIASTGSGGSSVSAGISEALVETALGLAVAIPAVLAFHYLTNEITRDEGALNRSAGELLDTIEDWAERDAQGGAHGPRRERVA